MVELFRPLGFARRLVKRQQTGGDLCRFIVQGDFVGLVGTAEIFLQVGQGDYLSSEGE